MFSKTQPRDVRGTLSGLEVSRAPATEASEPLSRFPEAPVRLPWEAANIEDRSAVWERKKTLTSITMNGFFAKHL